MSEAFEAKKHAYRQTQDGIVVSFVIHPSDMPEHLALAPLGTRFGVAVAEIGDDEKPIELDQGPAPSHGSTANGKREALDSAPANKERRKFSELSLAAQAGIRCDEPSFQEFMDDFANLGGNGDTAAAVRHYCNVNSRAALSYGTEGGVLWSDLEKRYQMWVTDRQYASARR